MMLGLTSVACGILTVCQLDELFAQVIHTTHIILKVYNIDYIIGLKLLEQLSKFPALLDMLQQVSGSREMFLTSSTTQIQFLFISFRMIDSQMSDHIVAP
jgi:hypothetical protein